MPISVSVREDLNRLVAGLDQIQRRHIPFAASRALNDTAQAARMQVTRDLPEIFDRPTPFTMNSIAVLSSRRDNLVASVIVKDAQSKYLELEETGGDRSPAGSALTAPSKATPLNAYGNMGQRYQTGLRAKAEADIARRKAARERVVSAYRRRRLKVRSKSRDQGVVYFRGKGPHGRGPGGYFVRGSGHTLRRLTGFEAREHYKPRFGFRSRVEATARATFADAFARRIAEAIASP